MDRFYLAYGFDESNMLDFSETVDGVKTRKVCGSGFSIQEQLLRINVKRFQGGLVFKAHRLVYHSTLSLRATSKLESNKEEEKEEGIRFRVWAFHLCGLGFSGFGLRFQKSRISDPLWRLTNQRF